MLFPLSQQHFTERSPPLLRLQRFHSSIPFTWTWLIPEDDHSQHGSLSFNWSLWDQIAGSSCNINGWRLPLTSPGAHWSPRWQPDGINPPHQAVLQFIKDLIWPFSAIVVRKASQQCSRGSLKELAKQSQEPDVQKDIRTLKNSHFFQ